jgi:hypothetical protein
MAQNPDLLKNLFNTFNPLRPLPAGDPLYVDCREVRGDRDILEELGREILLSDTMTCQLYIGHRGAGKSTELLRLQQYLDSKGCFVVYFAADEEDIDPEDAQHTDILLACARHLLEALKDDADPKPILNWLKNRLQGLKDLALTEINLEGFEVELGISDFTKLTTKLKAEPGMRQKIREQVNPHTKDLITALNQFISEAKKKLPSGYTQLLIIADNLDRIVPVVQGDGRTNHDHIFIDRNEQLKALAIHSHLIYTVPISMAYSAQASNLRDIYGDAQVLPMIMVRTREGEVYEPGLNIVKKVIGERINQIDPDVSLETDIFENRETLDQLCLMSGGHVRELILLVRGAIKRTDKLPIPLKSVQRAITEARDTYRRTVEHDQWQILAEVSRSKSILNDNQYRRLLFNRCLLEYRYFDTEGELQCWHDVHPLIKGIQEFKGAVQKLLPP